MQLLQKKFVSRMLKKFLYLLSGKVLFLFETLNFQKKINSKRYTSLNEQSYENLDFVLLWLSPDVGEILLGCYYDHIWIPR